MPELPEVHTIASDLRKEIKGYKVASVEIENGYEVYPNNQVFLEKLPKHTFDQVGRIGKNVVIKLSSGDFLTFHLAMTGRLVLKKMASPKDTHQKVELRLTGNQKELLLRFADVRMFGKVWLRTAEQMKELKQSYGPDVTSPTTTLELFSAKLTSKNTSIKNALLEQSIVSGIGNIYATDALWLARIHPERKTSELLPKHFLQLFEAVKNILAEGISHRGSTLPDEAYVDVFGRPGNHQNFFKVYGKQHCPSCKSKVQYKKVGGRGTYFCPICQT